MVIDKADRPITNSPSKPLYWKCRCECGNERIIVSHNLRCGRTTNCGCKNTLPDFQRLYNVFILTNKDRVSCDISFHEFLEYTTISKCHYCHSPIKWSNHGKGNAYNLDRKDNTKGYSNSNCVVCCARCNFGKGNRFTYDEWFGMTEYFRRRQNIVD